MRDDTRSESVLPVSRRRVLKAGAVSAVGVGLFSGTASATDADASITVECEGDDVVVTLNEVGETGPTDLENLRVVFGRYEVLDVGGSAEIDRLQDIYPCVDGADPDTEPTGEYSENAEDCQPVAYADADTGDVTENPDGSITYTFSRADAGLEDVTGAVDVVLAGTYGPDGATGRDRLTFDSYGTGENVETFDPAGCCVECRSGEELLVKYEWEDGEFITEGSDGKISIDEGSLVLDEDGEPQEVRFETTYCDVDAVVKAGREYDTFSSEGGEVCVTGLDGKAISNVQFFCVAPDDPSVGNSGKNGKDTGRGEGNRNDGTRGRGR